MDEQIHKTPWDTFLARCTACQACDLANNRTQVVVWRGQIRSDLFILGEAPGEKEDLLGLPFVGRSGELLDTLLAAWQIPESTYHIANIVKCRPPQNRQPSIEEARACRPLLNEQFQFAKPRVILLMGGTAYKYFTGDLEHGITKVRGQWIHKGPYWILPTFHPSYVLRDERNKEMFWDDFRLVREKLEELGLLGPLDIAN